MNEDSGKLTLDEEDNGNSDELVEAEILDEDDVDCEVLLDNDMVNKEIEDETKETPV